MKPGYKGIAEDAIINLCAVIRDHLGDDLAETVIADGLDEAMKDD